MNQKKTAKILLAIVLIISFSREGYIGYKETGNYWFFIIITSVSIIACGFLIKSAFKSPQGLQIENKYNTYFWNFILIFSIMSLLGIVFGPTRIPTSRPKSSITVKGIPISLDACMEGAKDMIKDDANRRDYCNCIATKLANREDVVSKSKSLLQEGKFLTIINELKEDPTKFSESEFEDCYSSMNKMEWTDKLKISVKEQLEKEMKQNGTASTQDVTIYCNCLLEGLYKQPTNEVLTGAFAATNTFLVLDSICKEKSKLLK